MEDDLTDSCTLTMNYCVGNNFCPSTAADKPINCEICKSECATCSGTSRADAVCESCNPGKYLLADKTCNNCDNVCATCTGPSNSQCLSCSNGHNLSGSFCVACFDGQVIPCKCGASINCATCGAAQTNNCALCLEGYKLDSESSCSECANGYFKDGATCQKCSTNCKTCSKSATLCDSCKVQFELTIYQSCQADCSGGLKQGQACVNGSPISCGSAKQITSCACDFTKNCLSCDETNKKCSSCLASYMLEGQQCSQCVENAEKIEDSCFFPAPLGTNLSSGAIAGIVVAVLVVLGALGGGLAFYLIKRSKK
ncbi:Cysteine-rich membrane protein 1 [Spironucleus salmonicida]|uniref:Cysteine-rich membrane protein 1 n=1 Tax=Spironucleus salmonicida TaxID=348837 RepID=V6LDY6_9EUKA|nr:Cysteine-rich membrane protein 1 [Spironucleus salmonicida]|eukprot:EST42493.1 Cysteine-rich membrane protein 1 [Spironucleus salmonicida]